jgi:DNA-directed RNA polymerase specialized sigma24 family protein
MEGAASLNPGIVADVEAMLGDGFVEGLVRRLCRDFPALSSEGMGAVGHAVEKMIVRPVAPTNPRGYLAASAYNEMKRLIRKRARTESLDALEAHDEDGRPGWAPADPRFTVEEQALLRSTYDQLRAHVETWETENVKVVTLLYLEAAFDGEPLTSSDAAELTGELLGYEVDDAFVRTWKSRGFKKLRDYVTALDTVDTRERQEP